MSIRYRCNATLGDLKTYAFEFELVKSGGFEYGNGTALIVRPNDEREMLFDTRYVNGLSLDMDEGEFAEWCDSWLSENYPVIAISTTDMGIN